MSGDTSTPTLPLEGIRVLELGGYISVPYCTSLLASLGAEVVKVERPVSGDDFRRAMDDQSPYFVQYNAGKRSLSLDLKDPEGVALVKALVPRFDVLVENMRPGKVDALGLDQQSCADLNPGLVYTSVTGFGNGGVLRSRPAYDTIGQAFGGIYSVLGDQDSPQLAGTCLADLITGITSTTGILAALVGRGATGRGQHVETSIMEAVSTLTVDAMTQLSDEKFDPTRQSRHPQAQNFCLRTRDDHTIALHLSSSQKFWHGLTAAMDRRDLADDPRFATYPLRTRHYFELAEIVEKEFLERTQQEWEERLDDADVPFAPVLTMSDYRDHPQTQWLDLIEPGATGTPLVRAPWRFAGSRPERGHRAPVVGQDSRAIAGEVYDEQTVARLIGSGVLFAAPTP